MELIEREITSPDYYASLLSENGKHPAYKKTVENADEMAPIVYGAIPYDILEKYRPNDPEEIKNYRLETYESEVSGWYSKVYNTLKSGIAPGSYTTEWPKPPTTIPDDEIPQVYFGEKYGEFGSIHNYFQHVVMNWLNGDAAAVMVIMPVLEESSEYQTIIPIIYPSSYVYWYQEDIITICLNHVDKRRRDGETTLKINEPKRFLTITPNTLVLAVAKDNKNESFEIEEIDNKYGKMIGQRLGGNYVQKGHVEYPKSYIAGVVPPWNKAIRLASDQDASYVVSMYPQRIQFEIPCSTCHGNKYEEQKDSQGDRVQCRRCGGSGLLMGGGPFGVYTINPQLMPDVSASDVIHYASPDVDIIQEVEKKIRSYELAGYAALNMDVVGNQAVGANESGFHLALNRKELTAFLSEYTNRVLDLMEWTMKVTSFFRYFGTTDEGRKNDELLPIIYRPHRYDSVTADELYSKLKTAKDSGAHPSIIRQIQKDIVLKEFGPKQGQRMILDIDLDPFPGSGVRDLVDLNMISTLDPIQVFIKSNLARLIETAIAENTDFEIKPISEQREIIKAIAEVEKALIPEPTQFNLENQVRKLSGENAVA